MAEQQRRRRRPRGVLVGGLAAIVVTAVMITGGVAAGAPALDHPVAGGVDPGVRVGDTPRTGRHGTVTVPVSRSTPVSRGRVSPSLQCADCDPDGGGGGGGYPSYGCNANLSYDIGPVQQDGYLEETVHIGYSAWLSCNYALDSADGGAAVKDRSPAFNGQTFEDSTIDSGSRIIGGGISYGTSSGSTTVSARTYNGGRTIEPVLELNLLNPSWLIWSACNPIPGLRYLACDGLGTRVLHVAVGTGPQTTALTRACRDQTEHGDVEQARLDTGTSGSPTPIQLVRRVAAIEQAVIAFKHDLCGVTNASGANSLAADQGLSLWTTAVGQAQAHVAGGDDRPLYWARLSMTRALRQWRPTFGVDYAALRTTLEHTSRGMTSIDFSPWAVHTVLVSGFDPFQLYDDIAQNNPSGASALALDDTTLSGAHVQTVIFPTRFADFNDGLVEQVFGPQLATGGATLVVTASQGGSSFDLEQFNGRNRSDVLADNLGGYGGVATQDVPVVPSGIGPGEQFVDTSLPIKEMALVGGTYPVRPNPMIRQILAGSTTVTPSATGPTCRTPGCTTAVYGSGEGWLSNEIAYRVTRLRDEVHPQLPAGHVHVPTASPSTEAAVVAQFTEILRAAVIAN